MRWALVAIEQRCHESPIDDYQCSKLSGGAQNIQPNFIDNEYWIETIRLFPMLKDKSGSFCSKPASTFRPSSCSIPQLSNSQV